jgi:MscS family membrane protein
VATYTDELACRDELNRAILELSERLGVELVVSTKKPQPTASVAGEAHSVPPPPKHLGRERAEAPRHGHSLPADGETRAKRSSS